MQVWIRPIKEDEYGLMAKWLYEGRAKNRFNPEIFLKKQVRIYVAFDGTGIVGFIPVAAVYLLESLAFRPDISPITEAKALQAMQHVLVSEAAKQNVPDAFFVTYDESVTKFAKNYGWKEVVVPMLNLHFSDLEPKEIPNEDNN